MHVLWNNKSISILDDDEVCGVLSRDEAVRMIADLQSAIDTIDSAAAATQILPNFNELLRHAEVESTMDAVGLGRELPEVTAAKRESQSAAGPIDQLIAKIQAHPSQAHLIVFDGRLWNVGEACRVRDCLSTVIDKQTSRGFGRFVSVDPNDVSRELSPDQAVNLAATNGDR